MIAAAAVPEITKAVAALGAAKDVCLLDYIYQPMIRAGKGRNAPEKPDPRYPAGIRVQIPAWMTFVAALLGVSLAALIGLEAQGKLGGVKEMLGLKQKKGSPQGWGLPFGF